MHAVYFYIQKMEFVKINLTNILIPPSMKVFCGWNSAAATFPKSLM